MARHINSFRRLSARHQLVLEDLLENQPQTWLNALSIAFTVAIKLTLSEVSLPPDPHHLWVISVLRWLIGAIVWFALLVSIVVMAINRVSQVRERTRQFAIVRMLGASFSFIAVFLAEETIFVALPGAVIGIALARLVGWLSVSGMPDTFGYETDFWAWLWAPCIAAICFFFVSALTAWVITSQQDVLSALSSK
jgi:ABC-type antimicrobial peptide transport system permease subunit